jgi:hypothetical protein
MVEHVNILDVDRHEVKHASSAADRQALLSKGDGTTEFAFVPWSSLSGRPAGVGYRQIVVSNSTASSQVPAAVDTPIFVEFGPGAVTPDVTLNGAGRLTFTTGGDYMITLAMRQGRTAGPGTAVLLTRLLFNGVQSLNSNSAKLPDQDSVIPFAFTVPITVVPGDYLELQLARDSGGVNNGGLYRIVPTVLGWSISPTATLVVSKFGGNTA